MSRLDKGLDSFRESFGQPDGDGGAEGIDEFARRNGLSAIDPAAEGAQEQIDRLRAAGDGEDDFGFSAF